MNNLLFDEHPLVLQPKLAKIIGLNEAIILQQLNYWLKRSNKFIDGHVWIYNTYSDWQEQFPFFSKSTIRRTISSLEEAGIIITANYNKAGFDKTKWYSIDENALTAKIDSACVQNEQTMSSFWTHGSVQNEQMEVFNLNKPIPETTRDYSDNNNNIVPQGETSDNVSKSDLKKQQKAEEQKQFELQFETLWKKYPKKSGKPMALKAFLKAVKSGVEIDLISTKLDEYNQQIKLRGTEKQWIKNGSTWFNQQGWLDEYDLQPVKQQMPLNRYGREKRQAVVPKFLLNQNEGI